MPGWAKFLIPISLAAVGPGAGTWLVLRDLEVPASLARFFATLVGVLAWPAVASLGTRIINERDQIARGSDTIGSILVGLGSFCLGWLAFIFVAEQVVQHTVLFDLSPKEALERIALAPLIVGIKVLVYGAMIGFGVLLPLAVVSVIYEKLRGRPLFPGIGSPPK